MSLNYIIVDIEKPDVVIDFSGLLLSLPLKIEDLHK